MGHFHDKKAEKKRIDGLALKSPMKVFGAAKSVRHAFSVMEEIKRGGA